MRNGGLVGSRSKRRLRYRCAMTEDVSVDSPAHHSSQAHVSSLLDRDQRTALSRSKFDDMQAVMIPSTTSCPPLQCSRFHSSRSYAGQRNKWNLLRRALHRSAEVLVVCVCLLSVVRIPVVMSAPANRDRMASRPKWINPCGVQTTEDSEVDNDYMPRLNDVQILTQILVQAKNALMHTEQFRDQYVKNTFNVDLKEHNELWKSHRYLWLPNEEEIPKSLGDPTPASHLAKLEMDSALKNIYQYMQKYAVGLEQVTWDQEDNNSEFKEDFKNMEYKLRATLCEIQVGIIERNLPAPVDVTRGIMDDDIRHITNTSFRNIRDWLVFRDYMNCLEYIIEVFEYFKKKLTS